MANTRILKSKVEDYTRKWLKQKFGRPFQSKFVVLSMLFVLLTPFAVAQTRVFLEAGAGYKTVAGVDHTFPRTDSAGHNQFMELAKTFLQRCPEVTPTVNKDKADFVVTMNWAPATRFFLGGKLIHKPDQIIVTNKESDIIFSGVARTVGGNTDDACKAIMHGLSQQAVTKRSEPAKKVVLEPIPVEAAGTARASAEIHQDVNLARKTEPSPSVPSTATPKEESRPVIVAATSAIRDSEAHANSTAGLAEDLIGVSFTGSPTVRHDGLEIADVLPKGPADNIDIKPGDVIVSIDGHYLYTIDELRAELLRHEPGALLAIRYRHGRLTSENYITLGSKGAVPRK